MDELRRFSGLRLRFWHTLWRFMTSRPVRAAKPALAAVLHLAFFAVLFAVLLTWLVLTAEPDTWKHPYFQWIEQSFKWQILALAGLLFLLLLVWIHHRRQHLLIDSFKIHPARHATPEGEEAVSGEALASYVQNELARLLDLFRHIDEASVSGTGNVVQVTPVVIGDEPESILLAGEVSPEMKVKLWQVEIPIGIALSALGRLFPAPRLTGSLHEESDGELILIGTLRQGRRCWSWRVTHEDLESPPAGRRERVRMMAEYLVYRMVADLLPSLGSPRWQAVRHYTAGLRHIRSTFKTTTDKARSLRKAERCFRRALAEDKSFARCHFNLGYVYKQMEDGNLPEAAVAAFRSALKEKPGDVGAWYAVAQVCYDKSQFDDAIWLARNTLHLDPHHAAAHNLLGLAMWERWKERRKPDKRKPEDDREKQRVLAEVQKRFAAGAVEAWRACCRALRVERNLKESEDAARICELNLGMTLREHGQLAAAEAAFRRALRVRPNDYDICFEQGQALLKAGKWLQAFESLDRVLKEGLASSEVEDLWLYLMIVHSHLYHEAAKGKSELLRQWHRDEVFDCLRLAADQAAFSSFEGTSSLKKYAKRARKLFKDQIKVEGTLYLSWLIDLLDFLEWLSSQEAPELAVYLEHLSSRSLRRLDPDLAGRSEGPEIRHWLQRFHEMLGEPEREIERQRRSWVRAQVALQLTHRQAAAFLKGSSGPAFDEVRRHLRLALGGIKGRRLAAKFEQPLRLLFARVYLCEARRKREAERVRPSDLLARALDEANRAAALAPDGFEERLLLGQIYLEIGDYNQARTELTACIDRAPEDPLELIEALGRLCLERAQTHDNPQERQAELLRGLEILEDARERLESSAIIPPKAHAAVHHWLGRLESEMDWADAGVAHLKAALALGYAHR